MKNKVLRFVYTNLYVVWGIVVVCTVATLTGALTATILGATAGISMVSVFDKIIK